MRKITSGLSILVLALLTAACQSEPVPTEPVLEDAWIRSLPPGMKMPF